MKSKVIAEPTLVEFTEFFLCINRGAAAGLARLGVLPSVPSTIHAKGKCASDERVNATIQLYNYLRQELLRLDLEHLMPDIVTYEHTLCKLARILGTQSPRSYSLYRRYSNILQGVDGTEEE